MFKTNLRFIGWTVIFVIVCFCNSYSQNSTPSNDENIKTVSGGVVNGKAANLVKPAYPPAAKAVGASGAVNVQVLIDENGNVVSAKAVSGHPLLRAAAEQAALASKFSPTTLQGQPVKISGTIVYNFVAPINWLQIGYFLSKAEASKDFSENLPAVSIASAIPPDWTEESQKAGDLAGKQNYNVMMKKNAEIEAEMAKKTANTSTSDKPTGKNPPPTTGGFKLGVRTVGPPTKDLSKINELETVQALIPLLKNRLVQNELRSWDFNVGVVLAKLETQKVGDESFRESTETLRQLQFSAPNSVPPNVLENVKKLVALADKGSLSVEEIKEFGDIISSIRRMQRAD